MERVLIVGAVPVQGAEAFYSGLLAASGLVIAADGAGEWCVSLGRVPDIALGDFDSAAPGAAARLIALGAQVVAVSPHKDESDLDLCAAAARRAGALDVCFTAAFTARLDHTLCALGAVLACADLNARVQEPSMSAWTVGGTGPRTRELDLPRGSTFSLVAPAGADGVSVRGGRYALHDGVLPPLSSLGLSNVSDSGHVCVTVRTGSLLVIAETLP
jgi:thiamine pyrophosphokinase